MRTKSIELKAVKQYINEFHRHHKAPQGWKFGTSLVDKDGNIIGVVTVGRPVSRVFDDGNSLEVTRLCTDQTKNACSKLYGVARRVGFELGYDRIITYTLTTEDGTSLKASGWILTAITQGGAWSGTMTNGKKRKNDHPLIPKYRWEVFRDKDVIRRYYPEGLPNIEMRNKGRSL